MTRPKQTPLTERPIPGLNWKILAGIIAIVGSGVLLYAKMEDSVQEAQRISRENNAILREMQADRKIEIAKYDERDRVTDARLDKIETDQKLIDLKVQQLLK